MKLKINAESIKKLHPCKSRFDNYLNYYGQSATFAVKEFIELDNITYSDKLWVLLRMVPRELVEVFAIDCAVAAANRPDDSYAAVDASTYAGTYDIVDATYIAVDAVDTIYHAANAAYADATDAAADATAAGDAAYHAALTDSYAAADAERQRQLDALAYLIETYNLNDWRK